MPTLKERWNAFRNPQEKRIPRGFSFIPLWAQDKPHYNATDFAGYVSEGFNINALIYSAMMYKYRSIASAPLRAYSGDPDNAELLPASHPLARLVARPNTYQSGAQFIGLVDIYLNLAGDAPILIVRNGADITSLIPLRPDRLRIIPARGKIGPDGTPIMGYLYLPEGASEADGLPILPNDLIMPKFPNPGDPLQGWGFGLSPLSSAAQSATIDNAVTNFLALFFQSGTMVNHVLKFDIPLNDTVIAGIKERWKKIYGGWKNWGDIGVLDKSGTVERLGYNFEEMGFDAIDARNESRILAPLGVPPILIGSRMGLERSTYSNYEQARAAFWQDVLLPEQHIIEDELKYYLTGPGGEFVQFDNSQIPALQKDKGPASAAFVALVGVGIPKNTAARIVGLDIGDVPDGDTVYMPLQLVPYGQQAEGASQTGQVDVENDNRQVEKVLNELRIAVKALEDASKD